jgi:plasmid stabilization system protein ParE
LSLSKTRPDEIIALAAISRADLRDLQSTDFFLTVHAMSVDGLDTTAAAFKILTDDRFQAFIPQHSLTLNQEMCLTFLLLPTDETFYLNAAESRLFQEQSVAAQKSLMTLLANTVTKQGDAAIARFVADTHQPAEARAYARTILDATQKMASMPLLCLSLESYAELKTEQRQLLARVSDEALDHWDRLRIKVRHRGPQ